MKILPASPSSIDEALRILGEGGVIAHATETCYGLACDLSNPAAVEKLFAIKERPADQPVSALFATVEEAKKYVQWNERAAGLASKYLPGPLTLILLLRKDAPHALFPTPNGGATLGIRVSSHPLATELARRFERPISTTSANVHGQSNLYSTGEIIAQFHQKNILPDLILDEGLLPTAPPSTVIDLTTNADNPYLLRRGMIDTARQ